MEKRFSDRIGATKPIAIQFESMNIQSQKLIMESSLRNSFFW